MTNLKPTTWPWSDFATLIGLVEEGPLFDGDVPSKEGRDRLIKNGYAIRVPVEGESGFTAATPKGVEFYLNKYQADTIKEGRRNRLLNVPLP